jgi:poly(3-hydroxybutyrate) depolymerase
VRQLGNDLCIDTTRIFSYGFSAGARFTNLLACVRGGVLRGVAPVSGPPAGTNCTARVAAWLAHGTNDDVVNVAEGMAARDRYRAVNGCGATTQPTPPPPCVRYEGCSMAHPVVWCQTPIGHDPMGAFSGPGAWNFFKALP